MYLVSVVI